MILKHILLGVVFTPLIAFAEVTPQAVNGTPVYKNPRAPLESRVQDALSRMSFLEKLDLVSGTGFATRPVKSLGIPAIEMTDGPLGVRFDKATAFPSGLNMGATFNPEMARIASKAMAQEAKALGKDMLLGPCIDISRQPFGGRNFESFGEDPYLTSQMTVQYLSGVQGEGVIPSTKHFALNDQEYKRMSINVIADERTMQEIHLPAFHAAVNAGTYSIMASYNKLNGFYASENAWLLNTLLKKTWGFKGFVVSDWGATHSTVAAANNGLDLEMPIGIYFGIPLWVANKTDQVSTATIDDKVRRILRGIFESGLFDRQGQPRPPKSSVGGQPHLDVARKVAEESIVLLKNDAGTAGHAILPLQGSSLNRIALIGPSAIYGRTGGGGSSMVSPTRVISPMKALQERLPSAKIGYAMGVQMNGDFSGIGAKYWSVDNKGAQAGVKAEFFSNPNLQGAPVLTRIDPNIDVDWGWNPPANGIPQEKFSVRWTGYLKIDQSDLYTFSVRSDDGVRVFVDDKIMIDDWHNHALVVNQFKMQVNAGQAYKVRLEYYQNTGQAAVGMGFSAAAKTDVQEAVALAANSDVAIVFAGLSSYYESEGSDRKGFGLPDGQDNLIAQVIKANPNTVVVINAGNPVAMPWLANAKAVVYAWYPGQEGGYAVADVLLGNLNPSGKTPVSFPKRWEDASAFGFYPEDKGHPDQVTYSEGIYVGYRHFDQKNIEPLFPFGFGLSYTTFQYENLDVAVTDARASAPKVDVAMDLTNSGAVAGAEVVELYVHENAPKVDRPPQELKGFQKILLQPGETKHVVFKTLDASAFAYWDVTKHAFTVKPGAFEIRVGSSSRDIQLRSGVTLQ